MCVTVWVLRYENKKKRGSGNNRVYRNLKLEGDAGVHRQQYVHEIGNGLWDKDLVFFCDFRGDDH